MATRLLRILILLSVALPVFAAEVAGVKLEDNVSEAEMNALAPRIKQLSAVMGEMKEAKQGMRITLDWLPGAGTQVTVQGKPAGGPIPGEDFYRALLKIWLGENPVQADLKKALLGEMRGEKR